MRKLATIGIGIILAGSVVLGLAACSGAGAPGSGNGKYPGGSYTGPKTGCTVTDKAAIGRSDSDGNNTTDYRVYSSCGTFGVQDDPFIGQWNSADTYGSIVVGQTYDFEAYGWRNGLMSQFPNIKKAYLVEAKR